MRYEKLLLVMTGIIVCAGCRQEEIKMKEGTFGDDLEFVKQYTYVFDLPDKTGKS